MRVGVVQFPGSCDERDAAYAVALCGGEPVLLWHADTDLAGVEAVILPGGFTYGDYLRTGAIAQFAPMVRAVSDFAARGGPVLGICNGFQVLCETGLLPGALTRNAGLRFVHRTQHLVVSGAAHHTPWAGTTETGQVLRIPIKHGEGRYVHPDPAAMVASGQVLVRYCDERGAVTHAANPNGSVHGIAGVTNAAGNVAGMMPHPEHAVDPLLGSTDGRALLAVAGSAVLSGANGT